MKTIFETITDALVEDGYIVIENGFSMELFHKLTHHATSLQNYKHAGISNTQILDNNRRRDKIHWLEEEDLIASEYLSFAKELQNYLNRTLYLGLRYYEAHFAKYEKGDFYEKHLDSFQGSKNRVVTTVYYLNENYQEGDGGELVIYDLDNNELQKVQPKGNTLVVFLSEKFPHEVLPANTTRNSIAGWFRIDK